MEPETWTWPESLDALEAAPETHRLLFENDTVRVLETTIPPGHTTALHTHRWPSVLYYVSMGHFVRRDAEETIVVDTRGETIPQAGSAGWGEALPPHTLENVDTVGIHIIGVELKRS